MAWHQCTQCSEKFRKKGERDSHNKKAHQTSCELLGGRITATKLTRNGKWLCPFAACRKLLASTSTLAKHYEKFHGSAVVVDPITASPPPGGHIPQAPNSLDGSSTEGDDLCRVDSRDREDVGCSSPWGDQQFDGPSKDRVEDLAEEELWLESEWAGAEQAFLAQLSLRYVKLLEMDLRLLVCSCCNTILDGSQTDHVLKHVKKTVKPHRRVIESLKDWLPTVGFITNKQVLVELLKDPMEEPQIAVPKLKVRKGGYSCPYCTYHVPGLKVMDNHFRLQHQMSTGSAAHLAERVDLQCIFVGKYRKYFPVQFNATGPESVCRVVHKLKRPLEKLIAARMERSRSHCKPEKREMAPFIRHSQFHRIAEELWPEGASFDSVKGAMCITSEEKEGPYGRLEEATLAFLLKADSSSKEMAFSYRENVRHKGSQKETSNRGFGRHLLKSSIEDYSKVLCQLVLCILRYACDDPEESGLKLIVRPTSPDLLTKARELKIKLADLPPGPNVFPTVKDLKPLQEVLVLLFCPTIEDPMHDDDADELDLTPPSESVVTQFMVLWSLRKLAARGPCEYSFKEAGVLGPMMAKLKYCVQATVELQVLRVKWDELFPMEKNTRGRARRMLVWTDQAPTLLNTPMNIIAGHGRLATSMQNGCAGPPSLVYGEDGLGDKEADCWLNGDRLSAGVFADVVNHLVEKIDAQMFDNVLRGLNTDWVEEMLASDPRGGIVDYLKNTDAGYSFLTEPANTKLADHCNDLTKHLFGTEGWCQDYICLGAEGNLEWISKGLWAWAGECDKLTKMMNLLLHFSMGQPARCKEVGSFLIRNTETNRRSFYWTNGTLVMYQTYEKTDAASRRPKVKVKMLAKELRAFIVVYLAVIRPTMAIVAGLLGEDSEAALIYEDKWYVEDFRRGDTEIIGDDIKEAFRAKGVNSMNAKNYRHLAEWLTREIRAVHKALLRLDEPLHTQAGHSARTAELVYGRDLNGHEEVSQVQWEEGMYSSTRWHKEILKLPADCRRRSRSREAVVLDGPPSLEPSKENGLGLESPPKYEYGGSRSSSAGVTPRFADTSGGMDRAAKRRKLLEQDQSSSVPCAIASNLEVQEGKIALRAKRALLKLGHAQWKTPEQAQAASLAVENVTNFIAVLPTGSGKSVIFMVAALSRKVSMVVVVVPLRMLVGKQMEACEAAGVRCQVYDKDNTPGNGAKGVVFVSIEEAGSGEFYAWAKQAVSEGRLHCIFLDEVHLLLCTYRSRMKDICRLSDLECQMIGLTASLRPKEELLVKVRMGKLDLGVIRSTTVRPNLCYSATNVSEFYKEERGDEAKMDGYIARRLLEWRAGVGMGNLRGANGNAAKGRAMVYCLTVGEAKATLTKLAELAKMLGRTLDIALLHLDMDEKEYKEELQMWESGAKPIVVATSVIGCGYDYPHVQLVLHRGMFFSLADYHQQSGRCGRDGHVGQCEVVYDPKYHARWVNYLKTGDHERPPMKEKDVEELNIAINWIQNPKDHCRRLGLHKEMDGVPECCSLLQGGEHCNVCTRQWEVTSEPPWEPRHERRYEPLNAANIERQNWILPQQPAILEVDIIYHDDLACFKKLRKFADQFICEAIDQRPTGAFHLCCLCTRPGSLPKGAKYHKQLGHCGHRGNGGKCLRCLKPGHQVKSCPVANALKEKNGCSSILATCAASLLALQMGCSSMLVAVWTKRKSAQKELWGMHY